MTVRKPYFELLCTAALTGPSYLTGAPDIIRLLVKEAPQTLSDILEMAVQGDVVYDMWDYGAAEEPEQEWRDDFADELSRRLRRPIPHRPKPFICGEENSKSSNSGGSGPDTGSYNPVQRPKRDSTSLERSQDEPNKRGRLSISSSNALSEAVFEAQRLAWLGERADEDYIHSDDDRIEQTAFDPGSEPLHPSEQREGEGYPRVGDATHETATNNGSLDQVVEETTFASDGDDDFVDADAPRTESEFEDIYVVGELELQENSDSEWSVV